MKLANKIGLSILIVTSLCVFPAFTLLYFLARNNLQNQIMEKLENMVESHADHIETYLDMLKSSIKQLSESVVLKDLLKSAASEDFLQTGKLETVYRMQKIKELNSVIDEYLVLDKTGRVIASDNEKNIGVDKSMDAIFSGGQKGIYIKDAYYSKILKEPSLAVSAPISDSQTKKFLGVLVAQIKLDDLNSFCFEKTGLGKTGELYIVNKDGFMITPSRFLKKNFLKQKVNTENMRQARLHTGRAHVLHPRTVISPNYRGVLVLGTHAYIPEMRWYVLAEMDTKEAFAPLVALQRIFIILLLITFIIVWLAGFLIAKIITRALSRLHKGIEIIGSGNLDYKVGISTRDEIGQLSRAFDKMTENLKITTTSIQNLSREVAARKETEEDLAITLQSIGDALITTDAEGRITRMNPVAEKLTGWKFSEAAGRSLKTVFHIINAETRQPAADPIRLVIEKGFVVGLANHTVLIARNGAEYHIADSAAPIRDAQGFIRGVVLIFHDISTEYHQREQLKLSEERFRHFFDNQPAYCYITSPDGKVLDINTAALNALGYKKEEILGKFLLDTIYAPSSLPEARKLFMEWEKSGKLKNKELSILTKTGEERVILLNMDTAKNVDGKMILSISVQTDITERKRAEEALRRIEWLLTRQVDLEKQHPKQMIVATSQSYGDLTQINSSRLILDSVGKDILTTIVSDYLALLDTSAAVYEKNGDYALGIFSSNWCRFLDTASRKLCDTTDNHEALACGKWLCHESCWTKCSKVSIETNQPVDIECEGGIRLYAVPIRIGGEIVGSINIGYGDPPRTPAKRHELAEKYRVNLDELNRQADKYETRPPYIIQLAKQRLQKSAWLIGEIIERKRAEAALSQSKIELEHAYRQLQEAFEQTNELAAEAQAASIAKGQFVANVSHEIRTPLNGIIGVCELMLQTEMTPEQKEYAQIINVSAGNLLNIINATLDFSKLDAKRMELERINFNLKQIMEEVVNAMIVNASRKKLELTNFIEPDTPLNLTGDAGRLRQILFNLIGNAIKFTSEGKITVTVATIEEKEGKTWLQFSVHDTGIGIPPDKIDLIFTPFTQIDESYMRKFGGTGLGLAISKGLVELMGGSIGVESTPWEGSNFWFVVPFKKEDIEPTIPATTVVSPPVALPTSLRILVVEDNLVNQKVICGILQKMGYTTVAVANGKEAIQALKTTHYDLVFMDIQMPEMDGFQATELIRDPKSNVLEPHVPILALTAHALEGDREKCLAAGMNGYLSKPITLKSVLEAISDVMLNAIPAMHPETNLGEDAGEDVFKENTFREQLSGDLVLMKEVLRIFLKKTPNQLRKLGEKIRNHEREAALHLAHTIKGSSANVYAMKLHNIADQIESVCDSANWQQAEILNEKLTEQFERLSRALQKFLNELLRRTRI